MLRFLFYFGWLITLLRFEKDSFVQMGNGLHHGYIIRLGGAAQQIHLTSLLRGSVCAGAARPSAQIAT